MIIVTGDIHGDAVGRFSYKKNPHLRGLREKDFVVILGDFGIPFGVYGPNHNMRVNAEKYNLNFLESKQATILALAGNHDDRNFTKQLPQVEKFGGKVREMVFENKHYPTIYYIDEPTVLTLEGKKCLFIPGAKSHDISDGIIDPWTTDVTHAIRKMIDEDKVFFRIKDWDWWEDEDVDIDKVEEIVVKDQEFDYIFSHTCPLEYFGYEFPTFAYLKPTDSEKYLQILAQKLIYKHWYHGHMHVEFTYHNNITCLYRDFKTIKE